MHGNVINVHVNVDQTQLILPPPLQNVNAIH